MEFLSNCRPSDKCNLITHSSKLLQTKRCLLAYSSTCNAFFVDLPVSLYSSLLTAKRVNSVVHMMVAKIARILIVAVIVIADNKV